jgi:hypothetical protein
MIEITAFAVRRRFPALLNLVHVERLRVPDIERLEFIEGMARFAPEELQSKFVLQFESAYRSIRKARVSSAHEMNRVCDDLLDFMAANVLFIFLRRKLTVFTFPPGLDRAFPS